MVAEIKWRPLTTATFVKFGKFGKFAKFVKKTKTGELYESDTVLFHKVLEAYKLNNQANDKPNSTYPKKI